MKRFLCYFLLQIIFIGNALAIDINCRDFKGVNIGNRFEDSRWTPDKNSLLEDIDLIASGGFNAIRLPIDFLRFSENKNALNDFFKTHLDPIIEYAIKSNLYITIDFHSKKASEGQIEKEKFISLWKIIADRYKSKSGLLIFDLLNEPSNKFSERQLNEWMNEAIQAIRSIDLIRPIIVTAPKWGKLEHLHELILTPAEKVYISFHYYRPNEFTHQGASWINSLKNLRDIPWPKNQDNEALDRDFRLVEEWRARNSWVSGVFVGEFGVIKSAPALSRKQWIKKVEETSSLHSFCKFHWQLDQAFGIYDRKDGVWITD